MKRLFSLLTLLLLAGTAPAAVIYPGGGGSGSGVGGTNSTIVQGTSGVAITTNTINNYTIAVANLDTNFFSATGIAHLLQLMGNTFVLTNVAVAASTGVTVTTNVVNGV